MQIEAPSEIAREVDRAFIYLSVASLLLLAGITLAMVIFVVKYRRSNTKSAAQFKGNLPLELTWIVIPSIIVGWMFFNGYHGFALMRNVPEGAMVVKVTGQQWSWSFDYPEEGITSSEMVVPVNTPVKVLLTAPPKDVLHSFYIPDFRVKEDVIPGRDTYLWFDADVKGVYNIFCAEFCGKDHAKMLSILRVVSQEDYDAWIHGNLMKRFKPLEYEAVTQPDHPGFGPGDLDIDREQLFAAFCVSCHGENGDGSGLPDLARDFRSTMGWKHSAKVTDIYRTLMQGVEDTQMRAYPNLTPWEKVALAHHVRSFLADAPADTEEDYQALVEEYALDEIQGPGETIPIEQAMDAIVQEAAGS